MVPNRPLYSQRGIVVCVHVLPVIEEAFLFDPVRSALGRTLVAFI